MTVRTGVIYLQKDKFQIYAPYIGRVFEFRFVPEIIRDLDVINSELLESLIKVFVANSKIAPSNLVIVLAENAYFTKDFLIPPQQKTPTTQPEVAKELLQKQAEEFIEHVPFDNVVSKTLPLKDGIKVCATNKDFYESIAISFEHLGFTLESVLPGLVLGNGISLRPVIDPPMANLILQKVSTVRQYNLLNQQVFQPQTKQEKEEVDEVELERMQNRKPDKKRLIALAGIFSCLLFLLVIVYVQSQAQPTPPKQPAVANTTNTAPSPTSIILATIAPSVVTAISPSSTSTQNIVVQIVNTTQSAPIAQSLLNRLDIYKFKSVSLQTQSSIGSAGTIVSFAPTVSQDIRNVVLSEVKKFESTVAVQEKQAGTTDITIVLGE